MSEYRTEKIVERNRILPVLMMLFPLWTFLDNPVFSRESSVAVQDAAVCSQDNAVCSQDNAGVTARVFAVARPWALITGGADDAGVAELQNAVTLAGLSSDVSVPAALSGSDLDFTFYLRTLKHSYFLITGLTDVDKAAFFDELLARVAGGESAIFLNCSFDDLDMADITWKTDGIIRDSDGIIRDFIVTEGDEKPGAFGRMYGQGRLIFVNRIPENMELYQVIRNIVEKLPEPPVRPGIPGVVYISVGNLGTDALITASTAGDAWITDKEGGLLDYRQIRLNPHKGVATAVIPVRYSVTPGSGCSIHLVMMDSFGKIFDESEISLTLPGADLKSMLNSLGAELRKAGNDKVKMLEDAVNMSLSNKSQELRRAIDMICELSGMIVDDYAECAAPLAFFLSVLQSRYADYYGM